MKTLTVVSQYIVGGAAYEEATLFGRSLAYSIALQLEEFFIAQLVDVIVARPNDWRNTVPSVTNKAFLLIFASKDGLIVAALVRSDR